MKRLFTFVILFLILIIVSKADNNYTQYSFGQDGNDVMYPYFGNNFIEYNGRLYGMTNRGGAYGKGIIFSVNQAGYDYKVLFSFGSTSSVGATPYGSLTVKDNTLYGMTFEGGTFTATQKIVLVK